MAATLLGLYSSRSKIGNENAAVLPEPAKERISVTCRVAVMTQMVVSAAVKYMASDERTTVPADCNSIVHKYRACIISNLACTVAMLTSDAPVMALPHISRPVSAKGMHAACNAHSRFMGVVRFYHASPELGAHSHTLR